MNNLPNSIIHLTFGEEFNQSVDKLPNSITHLTFGKDSGFNNPLDNLPINLKYLIISSTYKYLGQLKSILSPSVELVLN